MLERWFVRLLAGCSIRLASGCLLAMLTVPMHLLISAVQRTLKKTLRSSNSRLKHLFAQ